MKQNIILSLQVVIIALLIFIAYTGYSKGENSSNRYQYMKGGFVRVDNNTGVMESYNADAQKWDPIK